MKMASSIGQSALHYRVHTHPSYDHVPGLLRVYLIPVTEDSEFPDSRLDPGLAPLPRATPIVINFVSIDFPTGGGYYVGSRRSATRAGQAFACSS